VLDLYAGSGALGLEAVSRGASSVTFVESDRAALNVLRRNLSAVLPAGADAATQGVVVPEPVERVLLRGPAAVAAMAPVDLVLADPPYALSEDDLGDVLALLPRHGWLVAEAL